MIKYRTKCCVIVFIIFCLICTSQQKSNPESDSYVAAVLEYQFTENTFTNLENYLLYIQQAAAQDVDIMVFPEMTLTRGTNVRVPIHGLLKEHIPALYPDLFDEILVSLSSAARQHNIYLLVNVQEEMDCTNAPEEFCPEQKTYVFNTNIVFDRSGAVIDRYRKINLYYEPYTPALRPELGLFYTDFGVQFGHFICFDLMFQVPATQIVQRHNLSDIILTTMWYSEMPFLTAIQVQESYAYTMGVNLIAAGTNNIAMGSAGSGIYSGNTGALISIMPGESKTRLLVSRVPKRPGHVPYFRAFIKDGTSVYAHRRGGIVYCAVVACKNEDASSCPYRYEKGEKFTEFEELEIKMTTYPNQYNNSLNCDNVVYYPTSLKCNKFPLSPHDFIYKKKILDNVTDIETHENKKYVEIVYRLRKPQDGMISFAIWGRAYLRDVNLKNESPKGWILFLIFLFILIVYISYTFYKIGFKHSKEAEYKFLKQIS